MMPAPEKISASSVAKNEVSGFFIHSKLYYRDALTLNNFVLKFISLYALLFGEPKASLILESK